MAAHDLPNFDPRVLERSAEAAYRKANAIFTGCVAGGVVLGAAFGATPLTPIGSHWPIPQAFGFATMLLGAFLGGVVGYVVGDTRSALCRLTVVRAETGFRPRTGRARSTYVQNARCGQ